MSNKLKYIIFFGAIFGLLGFAHSIRCSETPIISILVGWLTICTAVFYFALHCWISRQAIAAEHHDYWPIHFEGKPCIIGVLVFSALQHAFIYIDMYMVESVSASLFFVWFYFVLGKAVDG